MGAKSELIFTVTVCRNRPCTFDSAKADGRPSRPTAVLKKVMSAGPLLKVNVRLQTADQSLKAARARTCSAGVKLVMLAETEGLCHWRGSSPPPAGLAQYATIIALASSERLPNI